MHLFPNLQRFEVLAVVLMKIQVLWDMMPYCLVYNLQKFRGALCLNLHGLRTMGCILYIKAAGVAVWNTWRVLFQHDPAYYIANYSHWLSTPITCTCTSIMYEYFLAWLQFVDCLDTLVGGSKSLQNTTTYQLRLYNIPEDSKLCFQSCWHLNIK